MKHNSVPPYNFLEGFCFPIEKLIFYDCNPDDLDNETIENYHAMTKEHTEILG